MYFEVYPQNPTGASLASALPSPTPLQWRWRLRGGNNEIIASGESYDNKQDCHHAIKLIMSTNQATPVREL